MLNALFKIYVFYLLNTSIGHLVFLHNLVPGNMRNNVEQNRWIHFRYTLDMFIVKKKSRQNTFEIWNKQSNSILTPVMTVQPSKVLLNI